MYLHPAGDSDSRHYSVVLLHSEVLFTFCDTVKADKRLKFNILLYNEKK